MVNGPDPIRAPLHVRGQVLFAIRPWKAGQRRSSSVTEVPVIARGCGRLYVPRLGYTFPQLTNAGAHTIGRTRNALARIREAVTDLSDDFGGSRIGQCVRRCRR